MTVKKKVLLIEDDAMLSSMYETKFSMEKIPIALAADGQQGLEMARDLKPAVILLDIILPKLDGFSVLAALKEDATTKDIPVILLTNLGQDEDVKKGKKLGAEDYFVKSNHTPQEILDKAAKYL